MQTLDQSRIEAFAGQIAAELAARTDTRERYVHGCSTRRPQAAP